MTDKAKLFDKLWKVLCEWREIRSPNETARLCRVIDEIRGEMKPQEFWVAWGNKPKEFGGHRVVEILWDEEQKDYFASQKMSEWIDKGLVKLIRVREVEE
jgi:hypothetical protein